MENLLCKDREWYWKFEPLHFSRIHPRFHNWLEVAISLDYSQSYIAYKHPLWILFKNGYGKSGEWLPLIVSKNPYVPFSDYSLEISRKHFSQICRFVSLHNEWIRDLADGEIDIHEFIANVDIFRKILDSQKDQTVHGGNDT